MSRNACLSFLLLLCTGLGYSQRCNERLTAKEGIISSPNYPQDYPPNTDCYWDFLSQGDGACVKFSVEDLVIPSEETTSCPGDHFVMESCGSWWTLSPERYLCGDYTERISNSRTNSLTFLQFFQPNATSLRVSFHSDSEGSGKGFLMQYSILDREACSNLGAPSASTLKFSDGTSGRCILGPYDETAGVIKSPGYPDKYPSDVACVYILEKPAPEYCGVQIIVSKFDLEEVDFGTCHDFLAYPGCRRMCGRSKTKDILFYEYQPGSENIFLQFVSDFSTEGRGFLMRYFQVTDCFNPHQPECPNDQLALFATPSECYDQSPHDCSMNSECDGGQICCWDGCHRKCLEPVVTRGGRLRRSLMMDQVTGGMIDSGISVTSDQPEDWEKAEVRAKVKMVEMEVAGNTMEEVEISEEWLF